MENDAREVAESCCNNQWKEPGRATAAGKGSEGVKGTVSCHACCQMRSLCCLSSVLAVKGESWSTGPCSDDGVELSSGAVVREKRAGQVQVYQWWVESYLKSERLVLTGRQVIWAQATHRHGELLGDGGA